MMREGRMQPSVHTMAPGRPAIFCPTNVALLTAIGPGVISAMVVRSAYSAIVSHPLPSTTRFWIRGIAAYPPPKANRPIWK